MPYLSSLINNQQGPLSFPTAGGGVSPLLASGNVFLPFTPTRYDQLAAPYFGDRCMGFSLFYIPKQTVFTRVNFTIAATNCNSYTVSSLTQTGGTATATTSTTNAISVGDYIIIAGASPAGYNGMFYVLSANPTNTKFTYSVNSGLTTPATGSITASEGMSMAFYNVDPVTLLPSTMLSGSDFYLAVTSTGLKTITFTTPLTSPGIGYFYAGYAASRKTNNGSLLSIPCSNNGTNPFGILYGGNTSNLTQYSGANSFNMNQIWSSTYGTVSQLPTRVSVAVGPNEAGSNGFPTGSVLFIGLQP